MAKIKDPNRELAFKLWRESEDKERKGILKEIADKLGIAEGTVRGWKSKDNWNGTLNNKKKVVERSKKNTERSSKNITEKIEQDSENNKKKIIEEISEEVLGDDGLTEKQRFFCIYYMQSFNATQSAIKAGYSRETAKEMGYENLTKPHIKEYLIELKEKYAQEDYMESKRLLERHKQIAFADIKDFTEFKIEKVFMEYDEETEEPIFDKMFQFRIKDDFEVDGTLIKKIGIGKFGPVIELEDRSKSLDFLNKFYGLDPSFKMQKEKLEIERDKIKVQEERNKIIENANKPPSSRVEDMTDHELENYLKKYGGAQ